MTFRTTIFALTGLLALLAARRLPSQESPCPGASRPRKPDEFSFTLAAHLPSISTWEPRPKRTSRKNSCHVEHALDSYVDCVYWLIRGEFFSMGWRFHFSSIIGLSAARGISPSSLTRFQAFQTS